MKCFFYENKSKKVSEDLITVFVLFIMYFLNLIFSIFMLIIRPFLKQNPFFQTNVIKLDKGELNKVTEKIKYNI